jgi:hypothetical protein
MFSPFTIRHPRTPMRLVTLGWPQFVALALSLCGLAAVLSILFEPWISETFYIFRVRQYEQEFGFELGRVKGFANEPSNGWLGFTRVTPDGPMHRAGVRGGDIIFNQHGRDHQELSSGLEALTKGRTICFFVINADEYLKGTGREVCVEGRARAPINRN